MTGHRGLALVAALGAFSCTPSPAPVSLLDTGWFTDTAGSDTDTDTTTECTAKIIRTSPEAGDVDWYWRTPATVSVDGYDKVYDARVIDPAGAPVPSEMSWSDDFLTFQVVYPDGLQADTQHLLEVTDCLGTHQFPFTTSSFGHPLDSGPTMVTGRTYDLRLDDGVFIEPSGMSAFLSPYLNDPILLQVQYATEEYIDLTGTQGYTDLFGDVRQDWGALWNFPVTPFGDHPYFDVQSDNVFLEILGLSLAVEQFRLNGTFAADAESFGGATLSGMLDTRTAGALIGQPNNPDAFCAAATAFNLSCVPCADTQVYCMEVLVEDLEAEWVPGLVLRPGL